MLIGGVRSSGFSTRLWIEQAGSSCGQVSCLPQRRNIMATSKFTFVELKYSWIQLIQTWLLVFQISHVFKLNSITLALTLQSFKIGFFQLLLFPTFLCPLRVQKSRAELLHATEVPAWGAPTLKCRPYFFIAV